MGKLLKILGVPESVQENLPSDIFQGEQMINVMQTVYESAPESNKKVALAKAIAESVRLLLLEVEKYKGITSKKQTNTSGIPSTDPSTWDGTFNVGDKVKIRIDMVSIQKIDYNSPDNEFTILSIERSGAYPFQLDSKGNNVGGFMRPENPSGVLYLLDKNGGMWEGKDLELVEKATNQTPQPTPEKEQTEKQEPEKEKQEKKKRGRPKKDSQESPSNKNNKPQRPKTHDAETTKKIRELQDEIEEINDALIAFEEDSEEYTELSEELERLNNQIEQLKK